MNKFKKGDTIHYIEVLERKFTGKVVRIESAKYVMRWSDFAGTSPYDKPYIENNYSLVRPPNVFGGKSKVVLEDKNNG